MIKNNCKLIYHNETNSYWVEWDNGLHSQMIDKSIDMSNYKNKDIIDIELKISEIENRYRAFPL